MYLLTESGNLPTTELTSFEFDLILAYQSGVQQRMSDKRPAGSFFDGVGADGQLPGNPISHKVH